MPVTDRIDWMVREMQKGRKGHVALGSAQDPAKLKVKIVLQPLSTDAMSTAARLGVEAVLSLVRHLATQHEAVDRGHRHSRGLTEVAIWIRLDAKARLAQEEEKESQKAEHSMSEADSDSGHNSGREDEADEEDQETKKEEATNEEGSKPGESSDADPEVELLNLQAETQQLLETVAERAYAVEQTASIEARDSMQALLQDTRVAWLACKEKSTAIRKLEEQLQASSGGSDDETDETGRDDTEKEMSDEGDAEEEKEENEDGSDFGESSNADLKVELRELRAETEQLLLTGAECIYSLEQTARAEARDNLQALLDSYLDACWEYQENRNAIANLEANGIGSESSGDEADG